jgi:hypothetical protein
MNFLNSLLMKRTARFWLLMVLIALFVDEIGIGHILIRDGLARSAGPSQSGSQDRMNEAIARLVQTSLPDDHRVMTSFHKGRTGTFSLTSGNPK